MKTLIFAILLTFIHQLHFHCGYRKTFTSMLVSYVQQIFSKLYSFLYFQAT